MDGGGRTHVLPLNFLLLKLLEGCIAPTLRTYEFRMRKLIAHGGSQMDLYTQEDIRFEKRMALLQRTAVAAVFVAIIFTIWSI